MGRHGCKGGEHVGEGLAGRCVEDGLFLGGIGYAPGDSAHFVISVEILEAAMLVVLSHSTVSR